MHAQFWTSNTKCPFKYKEDDTQFNTVCHAVFDVEIHCSKKLTLVERNRDELYSVQQVEACSMALTNRILVSLSRDLEGSIWRPQHLMVKNHLYLNRNKANEARSTQ